MKTTGGIRDALRAGIRTPAEFHELMQLEGRKIDPRSADIFWNWGQVMDPYGVYVESKWKHLVGRIYFVRALGSDICVSFDDLFPVSTHETK